jgi:hypothetical protein
MATFSGVLDWLGHPFNYYPPLAKLVGGVKEAVFLANLMRWSNQATGRAGIEDGWIYKSAEELQEETGLTYKEQWAARKTLVKLGVLVEQYRRAEHRIYFLVNKKSLDDLYARAEESQ